MNISSARVRCTEPRTRRRTRRPTSNPRAARLEVRSTCSSRPEEAVVVEAEEESEVGAEVAVVARQVEEEWEELQTQTQPEVVMIITTAMGAMGAVDTLMCATM